MCYPTLTFIFTCPYSMCIPLCNPMPCLFRHKTFLSPTACQMKQVLLFKGIDKDKRIWSNLKIYTVKPAFSDMKWNRNLYWYRQNVCTSSDRKNDHSHYYCMHLYVAVLVQGLHACVSLQKFLFCQRNHIILKLSRMAVLQCIKPLIFHLRLTFIKCSFFNLSLRGLSSKREHFNYIYIF